MDNTSKAVKYQRLTPQQTKLFFLKALPKSIKLLVETYVFASESYAEIGLSYTWKELFLLPARSVQKSIPPCISLYRNSKHHSKGELLYSRHLPPVLARKLIALAKSKRDPNNHLFSQNDGRPWDSPTLTKIFEKASKKASVKASKKFSRSVIIRILPTQLRALPKKDIPFNQRPSLPSTCFQQRFIQNIPPQKIKKIKMLIASAHTKSGKPSQHSLHKILKALIAERDFGFSRSELSTHFPSLARAAESQKRRWISKGIWESILLILDSDSAPKNENHQKS